MKREYFECQCSDKRHLMVVERDPEWGLEFQLQHDPKSFWGRLKFIFGGDQSQWCSTLVRDEDVQRLLDIVNKK